MALPANTKYSFSGLLDDASTPFSGYWEIVDEVANAGGGGFGIYTSSVKPLWEMVVTIGGTEYSSIGETPRSDEMYLLEPDTFISYITRGAPSEIFSIALNFTGGSGLVSDPIPDDLTTQAWGNQDFAMTQPIVADGTITSWTIFEDTPVVVAGPEFPLSNIRGRHRYTKGKRSSMVIKPRGFYLNRRR